MSTGAATSEKWHSPMSAYMHGKVTYPVDQAQLLLQLADGAADKIIYAGDIGLGTTVTYMANSLVNTVQNYVGEDEHKIVGSDVLIKEATIGYVQLYCRIVVVTGASTSTVKNNAINAVTQLISSLGIGQPLDQSDIIGTITEVANVDRVIMPLTRFDKNVVGSPAATPQDVITAEGNEVLRVGTITVDV